MGRTAAVRAGMVGPSCSGIKDPVRARDATGRTLAARLNWARARPVAIKEKMSRDEDLLRPTLNEEDDVVAFDRPWDPWSLAFVTFFGGPIAGGILYSWNFRRLGMPAKAPWCLAGFLLLGVAVTVFALSRMDYPLGAEERRAAGSTARMWMRICALAAAGIAIAQQRRRYRLFVFHGGGSARLFLPALGILLASILAQVVLVMVVVMAISAL